MYTHKNKEQAKLDRRQVVEGTLCGIYARNNNLRPIPFDAKTMNEIVDYIAPFFITMSQHDFSVLKETVKVSLKNPNLTKEQRKTLKDLFTKIALFC